MGLDRGLTPTQTTKLKGHFHPALLIYADHPDGILRLHTGYGDLSWDSQTWTGTGKLVQFQSPEERGGLATSFASIKVAATIEDVLAERAKEIRNRTIQVWFATTTEAAGNVLDMDPVDYFFGYFDSRNTTVNRSNDQMTHDMILGLGIGPSARSSASVKHNYEDQITNFPGDTAGRHVQSANRKRYNPPIWPE